MDVLHESATVLSSFRRDPDWNSDSGGKNMENQSHSALFHACSTGLFFWFRVTVFYQWFILHPFSCRKCFIMEIWPTISATFSRDTRAFCGANHAFPTGTVVLIADKKFQICWAGSGQSKLHVILMTSIWTLSKTYMCERTEDSFSAVPDSLRPVSPHFVGSFCQAKSVCLGWVWVT